MGDMVFQSILRIRWIPNQLMIFDLPVYTVVEQKSTGSATELLCLFNISVGSIRAKLLR